MNILVFPFGSSGDVHPLLGLALALRERGQRVTFFVSGWFSDLLRRTGLEFVELGTQDEFVELARHPDLWHPRRSFAYMCRVVLPRFMREQYALIAERYVPGETLVLTNFFGFGARLAQEKLGVPVVTIHCQPAALWSEYASPSLPGLAWPAWAPRWLKRFVWWGAETWFLDPAAWPETNRFRAELGLPPGRKITSWWNSPECVLCLFPEWFAPRQPDWPAQVVLTQFPLWDEDTVQSPQPELEEFLAAGPPPIVFTPGSANLQAWSFFQAAVEACRLLDRRGLLLSRFPEQVPTDLPASVRHFTYVPFTRLLPKTAALVHHGGIGTTAQGLRAGLPQLVMPLAHDQPDNATRLRRLGVGAALAPSAFRGPAVARELRQLLTAPAVRQACDQAAARFRGVDPLTEACAAVERLASRLAASVLPS